MDSDFNKILDDLFRTGAKNMKRMGHDIVQDTQPLILETIHTTLPNDDYVALATKSILDELLEELRDEILHVATIDEEADPTKDLEELERLLAMRPQSNFMEIQLTYTLRVSIATSTHTCSQVRG
ncbi:hypothetical protein Tco_0515174 [Tanacetum coccineum]